MDDSTEFDARFLKAWEEDPNGTVRQHFGRHVRDQRQKATLSQRELAAQMNAAGFSWRQTTAAKVEAGERPVPVEEVVALATLFGVSIDSLVRPTSSNTLADRIDREWRTSLAADRESRSKLSEHQHAEHMKEISDERLTALRNLEAHLDGAAEVGFTEVVRGLAQCFSSDDEWIDILVEVGHSRAILDESLHEARRNLKAGTQDRRTGALNAIVGACLSNAQS